MTRDDGGAAFPTSRPQEGEIARFWTEAGMSLRDYIAIQAMSGSLGGVSGAHLIPENLAREAYAHADAMLAERAK